MSCGTAVALRAGEGEAVCDSDSVLSQTGALDTARRRPFLRGLPMDGVACVGVRVGVTSMDVELKQVEQAGR